MRTTRTLATLLIAAIPIVACMENDVAGPELLEDASKIAVYWPERAEAWESKLPRDAGFRPALLEDAIDFAAANEADTPTDLRQYLEGRFANQPDQEIIGPLKERGPAGGIIVRDGYVIAEWGDTERVDMAFSITKSMLATLVGLAHDRGKIPSLDDRVGKLVDDGGYDSEHNAPITWRQSLQQTSEWEGTLWDKPDTADRREGRDRLLQAPGAFWEYNDVRVNRLALSATRVWGESLADVFGREIMEPIGGGRSWRWHGYRNSKVQIGDKEVDVVSGGGHWGGGLWISSRDLARVGVLYLRKGQWRDQQILSEDWIATTTTPSPLNSTYGAMWWLNTEQELWPSAPATSFAALGGGDNMLWVDPEHELVVVLRWYQRGTEDGFLQRLLAAVE